MAVYSTVKNTYGATLMKTSRILYFTKGETVFGSLVGKYSS